MDSYASPHDYRPSSQDVIGRKASDADPDEDLDGLDLSAMKQTWQALFASFGAALAVTLVSAAFDAWGVDASQTGAHHGPMYTTRRFLHVANALPFLGRAAARWGWTLGPNAGYIGQGVLPHALEYTELQLMVVHASECDRSSASCWSTLAKFLQRACACCTVPCVAVSPVHTISVIAQKWTQRCAHALCSPRTARPAALC